MRTDLRGKVNFAYWTNTSAIPGLEDAVFFIADIPEETDAEAVKARLALDWEFPIEETGEFRFQGEWPSAIQRQFDSLEADSLIRRSWSAN
jgi:hypothetical protein